MIYTQLCLLFSEHAHPVILLWDVKADDLKLLFNFMYEGQVNVAQERLSTFLTLAERLQVRGLTSTTGDGVLNRTGAVAAVKSIVPLVTPTGNIQNLRTFDKVYSMIQ